MKPKNKTPTSIGKKASDAPASAKKVMPPAPAKPDTKKAVPLPVKKAQPAKPATPPAAKKTAPKPITPPKAVDPVVPAYMKSTGKPKTKPEAKVIKTSQIAQAFGRLRRNATAALSGGATPQHVEEVEENDMTPQKPVVADAATYLPPATARRPGPAVKKPGVTPQGRVSVSDLINSVNSSTPPAEPPLFDIAKHRKS